MSELKSCPFCESENVGLREFDDPERSWVQCRQCMMTGPTRISSNLAVESWNVLPRNSSESQRWIPVGERLPGDEYEQVLWRNKDTGEMLVGLIEHFGTDGEPVVHTGNNHHRRDFTHWRPLPAAPEAE